MPEYQVVCAIILSDNKILCAQKSKTKFKYTSFKWEFPGGKIENGETKLEAITREIKEELDLDILAQKEFCTIEHCYPDFKITMSAIICKTKSKEFTKKEHENILWLEKQNLTSLDFADADKKIVEKILSTNII